MGHARRWFLVWSTTRLRRIADLVTISKRYHWNQALNGHFRGHPLIYTHWQTLSMNEWNRECWIFPSSTQHALLRKLPHEVIVISYTCHPIYLIYNSTNGLGMCVCMCVSKFGWIPTPPKRFDRSSPNFLWGSPYLMAWNWWGRRSQDVFSSGFLQLILP